MLYREEIADALLGIWRAGVWTTSPEDVLHVAEIAAERISARRRAVVEADEPAEMLAPAIA